jgi:membrane protease YdiL (CAAX protease family)
MIKNRDLIYRFVQLIPLFLLIIIERFYREPIDLFMGFITISHKGVYIFTSNYDYQLYRISWYFCVVLIGILMYRVPFTALGLNRPVLKPLLFTFLACLPILLGNLIFNASHFQSTTIFSTFISSITSAIGEEIYFRAFIFALLFDRYHWSFIQATLISGILFGIGHLYQTNDLLDSILVFAITFGGNAWFSWLFITTKRNLWFPIGMHLFMNLFWDLFEVENTAIGDVYSNIFRAVTIFLCSFFIYKKYKNVPSLIV